MLITFIAEADVSGPRTQAEGVSVALWRQGFVAVLDNEAAGGAQQCVGVSHYVGALDTAAATECAAEHVVSIKQETVHPEKAVASRSTSTSHHDTQGDFRLQFAKDPLFQSLMECLLGGLDGVKPYLDDIIVLAVDERDLARKLKSVLQVFASNGLRLRKEKYVFNANRLEFLGHPVSADGISGRQGGIGGISHFIGSWTRRQTRLGIAATQLR